MKLDHLPPLPPLENDLQDTDVIWRALLEGDKDQVVMATIALMAERKRLLGRINYMQRQIDETG